MSLFGIVLLLAFSASWIGGASSQNLPSKICEQRSPQQEWKAIEKILNKLKYTSKQINFGENAIKRTASLLATAKLNAKGQECGFQTIVAMSIGCIGAVLPGLAAGVPPMEADEIVTVEGAEKLAGRDTMTRKEAALIGAIGICFGQARELLTDS